MKAPVGEEFRFTFQKVFAPHCRDAPWGVSGAAVSAPYTGSGRREIETG
jgi:hypothetical protein